ncbi:MAG TPA: ribose-phosphate pyrophosphokinase [Gemmatimonadetes bacterium]|nr:ribose-phosphate pyrophosphokinase [Gemmatimonadota bacterium]
MTEPDGTTRPFNQHGGLTLIPMPGFEDLAREVKRRVEVGRYEFDTSIDVADFEFGYRASGEPYVRFGKEHIAGHDCVVLTSGPGTPAMLLQLMLILRYLSGRRASRIAVVAGYFPLGRSDKDEGALEFAMPPLIIDLMMMSTYNGLDRVITVDLHAPQVVMSGRTGFITEVSMIRRMLKRAADEALALGHPICLCFPDDTAAKRMESAVAQISEQMGVTFPVVYGAKRRTSSQESTLAGLFGELDAIDSATVLNLDDEIATGGTNIDSAAELKAHYGAARVWAVVTHGVLCGSATERFGEPSCAVDRVFISDTIPVSNRPELEPLMASGRLDVTSWCPDLSWILYHHHWNLSIRELR